MDIKKLRQEIYDDIEECLDEELRKLAKECDEDKISIHNFFLTAMKRIKEYDGKYSWKEDLMLVNDEQLNEKFAWIRNFAKRARENKCYDVTFPKRYEDSCNDYVIRYKLIIDCMRFKQNN